MITQNNLKVNNKMKNGVKKFTPLVELLFV